ncbi:MAG TPA: hypothetical protein DCE80_01200 [Ignavibacteriales bacterium]|nr:hypothetical protein [Ignavibacteriales bacterium]
MKESRKVFFLLILIELLLVVVVLLYFGKTWLFDEDISLNVMNSCSVVSQVGITEQGSNRIFSIEEKEGFLAFGQNLPLKEGNYSIKYNIGLSNLNFKDDPNKPIGYCDINLTSSNLRHELKLKDFLKDNPKKIILNFSVPTGFPTAEFRVFQYSGNNLALNSLRLNSILNQQFPMRSKEVKKVVLTFIGIIVLSTLIILFIFLKFRKLIFLVLFIIIAEFWFLKVEHSSDILAGCVMYSPVGKVDSFSRIKATDTKEGYLAYGPYLPLNKGKYKVKYKIFLDNFNPNDNPSRKVGYCDVDVEGYPTMGGVAELTVAGFKKKNPHDVSIKFSVPDGMPKTQYRVYQFSGNKLCLSSLKLYDVDILKYFKSHLDILLIVIFLTIFLV